MISNEQFLQKFIIGYLYYDPLADVVILKVLTLFYAISFYFVSFSCLAQIHKLKFKNITQGKICEILSKCEHQQSHYDFPYTVSKKKSYWVSLFYNDNLLAKVCFSQDPNFPLLHSSFLHCMDLQPYSHDCFSKISRTLCASRN